MNSSISSIHARILAPTLLAVAGLVGCLALGGCGEENTPPANPPAGANLSPADGRNPVDAPKSVRNNDQYSAHGTQVGDHDLNSATMPSDVNSQAKGAAKITTTDESDRLTTGTTDTNNNTNMGKTAPATKTVVSDRDREMVDDDMSMNRTQEQAKGVVGQTSDPVIAAENRQEATEYKADNTGRNTRDRNADSLTPMDQSEASADIAITADIRKRLIADERLSHTAKNIKIITRDGSVNLRGAVATSDEVRIVQEIARSAPGVLSVDSDIEPAR